MRVLSVGALFGLAIAGCGGHKHAPPVGDYTFDAGSSDTSPEADTSDSLSEAGDTAVDTSMTDATDDSSTPPSDVMPADSAADAVADVPDTSDVSDAVTDADAALDAADASEAGPPVSSYDCTGWTRETPFDALTLDSENLSKAVRIKGFAADTFVAVENSKNGAVAHKAGGSWSVETLPTPPTNLYGIDGLQATDLWAVGKDATLGRVYHRGSTGVWALNASTPPVARFYDVLASTTDVYILGGSASSRIWKKTSTGWSTIPMPTLAIGTVLTRMWGFDANSYFVAGTIRDTSGNAVGGAVHYFDFGSWRTLVVPADVLEVTDVHGVSPYDIYVTGATATGGALYHVDNLKTWTKNADASIAKYTTVCSAQSGFALAAGSAAGVTGADMRLTSVFPTDKTQIVTIDSIASAAQSIWVEPDILTVHFVHNGYTGVTAGFYTGTCTPK